MSILYTAIDLYVPQRAPLKSTTHHKPYLWSTRELCKCLVKKRCLWRKLRTNKHDVAVRLKYRECVHQWRHLIQQQQEKTEEHLIEANSIRSFYKFVNKRISTRTGIPSLTNNNDRLITDDYSKACMLNDYFASVGRSDNGIIPNCNKYTATCLDSIDINESNILVAIKKLKNNCTCGPDGLPPTLFKRLQYTIAKPLSIINNELFSVAFVPDEWKVAVITPVHKKRTY